MSSKHSSDGRGPEGPVLPEGGEGQGAPAKPRAPAVEADVDRAAILARRARFLTSAVAGLALASCDRPPGPPQACLSVVVIPEEDAGSSDAGNPTTSDAGAMAEDAGPPVPQPCLSPMPCLSVAPDPDPADVDAGPTPPAPCLSPPVPRPCLKPMPCLKRAPPTP